jgi:hypothetical protein
MNKFVIAAALALLSGTAYAQEGDAERLSREPQGDAERLSLGLDVQSQ